MSTSHLPLAAAIKCGFEIGCYTCGERAACCLLRNMSLGGERIDHILAGQRVTVRDEGQHPVGAYCIYWEGEPDICRKPPSCV